MLNDYNLWQGQTIIAPPRLSNSLRVVQERDSKGYYKFLTNSMYQNSIYQNMGNLLKEKRDHVSKEQIEAARFSFDSLIKPYLKKMDTVEENNGRNFLERCKQQSSQLIQLIGSFGSQDDRVKSFTPIVTKQLFLNAIKELQMREVNKVSSSKNKTKEMSAELIAKDLHALFGIGNGRFTDEQKDFIEKTLMLLRKLVKWVDDHLNKHYYKLDAFLEEDEKIIYEQQLSKEHGTDMDFHYTFEWIPNQELQRDLSKTVFADAPVTEKSASKPFSTATSTVPSAKTAPTGTTSSSSSQSPFTYSWLKQQCSELYGAEDLAGSIISVLEKEKEAALESALFDLLGENGFELMFSIMEHKNDLLKSYISEKNASSTLFQQPQMTKSEQRLSQFSIKDERMKEAEKQLKKEKTTLKATATEYKPSEEQLRYLSTLQAVRKDDGIGKSSVILKVFGEELPQMTNSNIKHIQNEGYDEFYIPAPEPASITHKEDPVVKISQLPEFAQLAFKGFTALNRVQSKVYPTAFLTNENMLVCAPTGCGKTNIALLCILREVGMHIKGGKIKVDEFKIVYVAPMKALAQEMAENFEKRLGPLGIKVREYTGDMQLSKKEVDETQLIITTPEKWDVVTRKSTDSSLIQLVKLLIIDEIHLLNEDRGPVLEVIVARIKRQVELSQTMIRILGLSATLPNYKDVAEFISVSEKGLFFFDSSYRPVPLEQRFIGVPSHNTFKMLQLYNEIAYDKVEQNLKSGHQIMIFVHARNETVRAAKNLVDIAQERGMLELFTIALQDNIKKEVAKSTNDELKKLITNYGIAFHHAGMLRSDRNLVEKLFTQGYIRVLCSTATLAWGVNLPAHTVIIKGTQLYDSKKGSFVELGMLDVTQIFGRAGRPQFDTSGEGIIITSGPQVPRYLTLLTSALPIESKLEEDVVNHLNAEVVLGTVANVREALIWLSYSFLMVRMKKNPMAYGISFDEIAADPDLGGRRENMIRTAAAVLDENKMCRFDPETGSISATDLGRVASHYYIHYLTIEKFNEKLKAVMLEEEILDLVCTSKEFENLKVREDEVDELKMLSVKCRVKVKSAVENVAGKVNVLAQAYISRLNIRNFALVSDCSFVSQSLGRIVRAMFEIVLKKGWPDVINKLLLLNNCIEKRMWAMESPLRQYPTLSTEVVHRLEDKDLHLDMLQDMTVEEIADVVRNRDLAKSVKNYVRQFPRIEMEVTAQPITRSVLRIKLSLIAEFEWNKKISGDVEPWWIFVEDDTNDHIYHHEYFLLKMDNYLEVQTLDFMIPLTDNPPTTFVIRAVSDRWIGSESIAQIHFKDIILPENYTPHTNLLKLDPLPISALGNPIFEKLYPKLSHFNPIQTQVFHNVYHSDCNILLGAPTGSGKTIVSELAILRLFNEHPEQKVIYIAPLKALVRERLEEWTIKFAKIGKRVIELTGDYTPDVQKIKESDIVITTPEKWDGISRNWQQRNYVKDVGLLIMDEIHMLGLDRGPILEVIVSRMRYIAWHTGSSIRFMGLSTALANAKDLADWLGIERRGLYNFSPRVRPVPIQPHIQGYSGKHYCPRMATMNKPTYLAILEHARDKPALVFVSSRRQTRLTAQDLISFLFKDENPYRFNKMSQEEMEAILASTQDLILKNCLQFGIGIHHGGLAAVDKALVEKLYVEEKIQVLVCTSTLAFGVNTPARLVVIKGTEYFDPKTKRYVDYPITDVLQMMGRAGRPGYDDKGIAVVMVEDSKKNFYKKFLFEPFPVESSLHTHHLPNHINAEIVSGTIKTGQDAVDYLTWTFLFRRLVQNPTYYGIEGSSYASLNKWLSKLIEEILGQLQQAGAIAVEHDIVTKKDVITPQPLSLISSYYYLDVNTAAKFSKAIQPMSSIKDCLILVCEAEEFNEIPVRHNEDVLNKKLSESVRWESFSYDFESPFVKTYLLFQAHFSRQELPIADYSTDTKSVLDNTIRIIQAYVDIAAEKGYLTSVIYMMNVMQMIMQGLWYDSNSLSMLPHMNESVLQTFAKFDISSIAQFIHATDKQIEKILEDELEKRKIFEILNVKNRLPIIDLQLVARKNQEQNKAIVDIHLKRVSKLQERCYAPQYPKVKDEGYWVIIGDLQSSDPQYMNKGELLALRRIRLGSQSTLTMEIPWSKTANRKYTVFLISDCYIGLDQQYDFQIQ